MSNSPEGMSLGTISESELGNQRLTSLQGLFDPQHEYMQEQPIEWKLPGGHVIHGTARVPVVSQETGRLRKWGIFLLREELRSLGRLLEADSVINEAIGYPITTQENPSEH